jgi:E3 ubiquitin-protein ligase RNF144
MAEMGSKAVSPPTEHRSSPVMAASATTNHPSFPIYISSDDEDDDIAVLGASSTSAEIQIQQAISIGSRAFPSGTNVARTSKESIQDRKGKRKLQSELPRQVIDVDDIVEVVDVDDDDDDSLILIKVVDNGKGKRLGNGALFKVGESSQSATAMAEFYCTICVETVSGTERFPVAGCAHAFCSSCVRQYIAAKVEQNLLSIGCPDPGCKDGVLHPEECRRVIPPPLFDRWGAALCEMALEGLKFYCPFMDCSALLVDDACPGAAAAAVTNVECPHCCRMFCARCKVPWHDGVDCAEFQRLGEDERGREDLLLRKVAQQMKWARCPRCRIYVEKVSGCDSMRCR